MVLLLHYDKAKADRAVKFIENLCHTKGKWAGKRFWLLPWQEQLIRDIFGIVKPDGYWQFRTAFVEICKKVGLGEWFEKQSTQASSNYGIDRDGRVALYVEEKNRSWCSSSNANDQRAITIECASDTTEPYAFRDVVYQTLIKLCIDICKRNGKNKLIWFGDKDKTLNYSPKSGEMILTVHRWFANKSCPGNWMYVRMGDLAEKVTKALQGSSDSGGG